MQVCPNCKNEIADGKKFCNRCGTPVNSNLNPSPDYLISQNLTAQENNKQYIDERMIMPQVNPPYITKPYARQKKSPLFPIILTLLIIAVLCGGVFWLFNDQVRDLMGLGKSKSSSSSAESVDSYKQPIKYYFYGMQKANAEIYLKAFSSKRVEDKIDDNEDFKDDMQDNLDNQLDLLEEEYGDDIKISYDITKTKELSDSRLDDIKDSYDLKKVTAGYKVYLDITIKGDDDDDENDTTMYVVKSDGEWVLAQGLY